MGTRALGWRAERPQLHGKALLVAWKFLLVAVLPYYFREIVAVAPSRKPHPPQGIAST
jgi:hypothetical protein